MKKQRCKKCNSPQPHMHPAMQRGGEVEICTEDFHLQETIQNLPEYKQAVLKKRKLLSGACDQYSNDDIRQP